VVEWVGGRIRKDRGLAGEIDWRGARKGYLGFLGFMSSGMGCLAMKARARSCFSTKYGSLL
jgi:hypothetical protein